jgi:hypothetical protein
MVLEVSVHGHFALLLWNNTLWWEKHIVEAYSPHGDQKAKRKTGRDRIPISPSEAHPQWPNFLPIDLTTYRFNHLINSTISWQQRLQHMGLWGHFQTIVITNLYQMEWLK